MLRPTCIIIFALIAWTASAEEHLTKHGGKFTSGCFNVEKAMKCEGSFEKEKGGGKKCEGGVKAEFMAKTAADDIADVVAPELNSQIYDLLPSQDRHDRHDRHDRWDLLKDINDDVSKAMLSFEDESSLVDRLGDFEKKVDFGGFFGVFWGCNVTLGMKDGELSKVVQCGVKGHKGIGEKPTVEEYAKMNAV